MAVMTRETKGEDALIPALVAQLSPDAAALVGRWSLEEHKLSYQGLLDTIARLNLLSSEKAHAESSL